MTHRWIEIFGIGVAGALGALARYGVSVWLGEVAPQLDAIVPWATLGINVAGAFALSVVVTLATHKLLPPEWRLILGVGFLGAFTTYSTFAVEADELLGRGETTAALIYVGGTLVGGAVAVWLGRVLVLSALR